MEMARSRGLVIGVVVVALVALVVVGFFASGYLRYDYKTMNLGMFGAQQVRTDRLTGKTEIYSAGKWQPIEIQGGKVRFPQGTTIHVQ